MSGRATYTLVMELLSDAIFGSGFSIPGGEDIAVYHDESGYPYLKGSTLKGLLRESLENLIAWSGAEDISGLLLGESGREGTDDARRVQLTSLLLCEPPADAEGCYSDHAFTALEDGIVKQGSLRAAACIRRGLQFRGEVTCAEEDSDLLRQAFAGIKWVGTLRSRGFGRVRIRMESKKAETGCPKTIRPCSCIRYRLRTQLPVIMTDAAGSRDNSCVGKHYITGSSVRGMAAAVLSQRFPDWFAEHKVELLSDRTRFLNAFPAPDGCAVLPSIKGFYEDKAERVFETVVKDGTIAPGLKRAKQGEFCAIEGNCVHYWSAETDTAMRIRRGGAGEETDIFQTEYLCAGQEFEGYILLDDPELAPKLAEAFGDEIWLGADRYEGFGKCSVALLEGADAPPQADVCGYGDDQGPESVLYMLALSPFTMLDGFGAPCGLDEDALAALLGIESVKTEFCSTSVSEYDSFNRTWRCRTPSVRMYDSGSIFKLVCSEAPGLQALRRIQTMGIGIRRAEGFGQVLFLRNDLFEGIQRKAPLEREQSARQNSAAEIRRAKYRWIMDRAKKVAGCGLSRSQLGSVQAQCEMAISRGGAVDELCEFLKKNLKVRGARHGARFLEIDKLIRSVLETPLEKTLGVSVPQDHVKDRLVLLCALFDHSRKSEKEGE